MKGQEKEARKGLQIEAKPAAEQIEEINEKIWEMDEDQFEKARKAFALIDIESIVGKDEDHPDLAGIEFEKVDDLLAKGIL